MVKHSPHKRWKGHCMMCSDWKHTGHGDAYRVLGKASVLRQFGKTKRLTRKDVPRKEEW